MELACTAGIQKIGIKAKEKHGIVTRIVRMTLIREFDPLIARALGGDASELLESIKSSAATKVEMPIDGIQGQCTLSGEKGDDVTIKNVVGIKAIGKASRAEEDDGPRLELVFDFPFALPAWDFFGQNVGGRAELLFTKSQLELGLGVTEGPSGKKAKKNGKPNLTSLAGGANGTDARQTRVAGTDEQEAASPEEAEPLRAERLEKERGEDIEQRLEALRKKIEIRPTKKLPDRFRATLKHKGDEYVFKGKTEEAAAKKVLAAVRRVLEKEKAGSFSTALGNDARAGEIAKLAEEQAKDEAATKKRLLKMPTKGPRPKVSKSTAAAQEKLQAAVDNVAEPNGAHVTVTVEDAAGEVIAQAEAGEQPLCAPVCDIEHLHTRERTAF